MMLSDGEILINRIAQDKLPLSDGLEWFAQSNIAEQRSILTWISFYLDQARPDQKLIDASIGHIPLKQSVTPIVLFRTYPHKIAVKKVLDLPDNELEKSFITLLTLFKHADKERRDTFCKYGCNHEWHNIDRVAKEQKKSLLARIKSYFG